MRGVGHGAQVVVGQDHARRRFNVRGKDNGGLALGNGGQYVGNRRGNPRRLRALARLPRFLHGGCSGNIPHVENLRPAVAEPAVAQHEYRLAGGKLARHRLHAVGAAAGHQRDGMRVVHVLEDARNVVHHALKAARHVVECAVGIDHRKFKQAVRVDMGQESGHEVPSR